MTEFFFGSRQAVYVSWCKFFCGWFSGSLPRRRFCLVPVRRYVSWRKYFRGWFSGRVTRHPTSNPETEVEFPVESHLHSFP